MIARCVAAFCWTSSAWAETAEEPDSTGIVVTGDEAGQFPRLLCAAIEAKF